MKNKQDLLKFIDRRIEECEEIGDEIEAMDLYEIKESVEQLEDRQKGKWEYAGSLKKPLFSSKYFKCNNCENISEHETYFCVNCGAKMEFIKGRVRMGSE